MNQYTTEELTDRWYDRRAVQNLAGKYVTSLLVHKERTVFADLWSQRDDVTLSFNDGTYEGKSAVNQYYTVLADNIAAKSRFLKDKFPDKIGAEDCYGTGLLSALPITTPVIEVAGDGLTAKGIWHVEGSDHGISEYGALSFWILGFLCIDFIKEGSDWKLWHVFFARDIHCPMGQNWAYSSAPEKKNEFIGLSALKEAPFTVVKKNYTEYTPERPFTAPPETPKPYEHFSDTFSY